MRVEAFSAASQMRTVEAFLVALGMRPVKAFAAEPGLRPLEAYPAAPRIPPNTQIRAHRDMLPLACPSRAPSLHHGKGPRERDMSRARRNSIGIRGERR